MSDLTKTPHTKSNSQYQTLWSAEGDVYEIPVRIARKYVCRSKKSTNLLARELSADLEKKYSKAGVLLKGTRYRENLTQVQMARRLNITQADLSKMECGKRSIGKTIAKRIEEEFGVNYRYFLE